MVLIYSVHVAYHITLFLLVNNIYTHIHMYIHISIPWGSMKNVFIMVACNGKYSKGTGLLVTGKGV
jgi:hypothetical protein